MIEREGHSMFNKVKNFFADKAQNSLQSETNSQTSDILDAKALSRLPLIANPGLITAIHALQEEETANNRVRFQSLIKSARLFITITALDNLSDTTQIIRHDGSHNEGNSNNHEGGIGIAQFKKNDKYYYYVFTDLESLEEWHKHSSLDNSKSEANIVTFNDLCRLILGEEFDPSGIIINAGREEFLVEYDFFKQISRNYHDRPRSNHEEQNLTDEPKNEGTNALLHPLDLSRIMPAFANDLTAAFKRMTEIHAVWMTIMTMNEQRYFALIVDFVGKEDDIFQELLRICSIHLDESEKAIAFSANIEPFNIIAEQLPAIFIRAN